MQVLAVAAGGRLDQEIGGRPGHPVMTGVSAEAILDTRHDVTIAPESTLGRVYGSTRRTVNTIHHQAVADAGRLVVVGTDAAGLIEAVESTGDWCGLGVQWHPEKLTAEEAAAERPLFEHLIAEARAYAARRRTGA
jgi:putative glutamine amidotransferase